jgi:hypothetical protein
MSLFREGEPTVRPYGIVTTHDLFSVPLEIPEDVLYLFK